MDSWFKYEMLGILWTVKYSLITCLQTLFFFHFNESYATVHRCFSATLLTWLSFSLQLLYNMNLLSVGVDNTGTTELNWSETNTGTYI